MVYYCRRMTPRRAAASRRPRGRSPSGVTRMRLSPSPRSLVWAAILLSLITALPLGGCAHKPPPPPSEPVAPAADIETLNTIRQTFQQTDPMARVGRVIETLPKDRLAAV